MDYIKDILYVNGLAFKRTLDSRKYFLIIGVILVFNFFITAAVNRAIAVLIPLFNIPFLWGIVRYLVNVATLSLLMVALSKVLRKQVLNFNNFTHDWQTFINPLMSTMFIFWLIEMLMDLFMESGVSSIPGLSIALTYAYQILESPLLETVYIEGESGQTALFSILDFLKKNYLQWIPIIIVFPILRLYMSRISFASGFGLDFLSLLPMIIVWILLTAFIYIYKGHLYEILSQSSMRKRKFMKEADDDLYR
ncbi:MAG: hypothetical protein Q4E50_04050 [Tissierellia bacterium]|nr:hypothetical protein [Tissierellia bacterium]